MDRPSFSFAAASLSLKIIASAALFDIPGVQSAVAQGPNTTSVEPNVGKISAGVPDLAFTSQSDDARSIPNCT